MERPYTGITKFKAMCGYCGWCTDGYWKWLRPLIADHIETCEEYSIKLYNKYQTGFDPVADTTKYLCRILKTNSLLPSEEAAEEELDGL